MGPAQIVLAVAAVCYLMYRRYLGDVLQAKRLLILPVVLTIIGLSSLGDLRTLSVAALVLIAVSVAVSLVLGVLRGFTVQVGDRDGVVWMRYRAVTLVLWAVNIAAKVGLGMVAHVVGAADSTGTGVMVALGLGILAESLVVLARAMRMESTLLWSKRDRRTGAPVAFGPSLPR
ncbi:DUF1453 domain-containing protein [Rhodococcus sp. D2-41]|uniref:DUF1453 domain-containing protein n=1 Tax=Speluncibacter jeojiensis TaxID=2710754 RepID=A0A9X4M174_9ACTN|nr:hypothetical protein [Rhodococcus sp. D2-41]MDG3011752.1 DUF1453 domain-containing protein [Rhodococcus sp. D2-41]MDG3014894.1 hypothetical protein [Corynebacteriales bacterium D3-21]